MKAMKNYRIVFTALAIILSALLLTTCISPFEEEIVQIHQENSVIVGGAEVPQINLPPGKGAILLKFGDDSRATIAPGEDYENLNFTVAVSVEDKGIIFEQNVKMNKDDVQAIPIILDEGNNYKVVVFGYYKTSNIPAYVGEADALVATGKTQDVPIKLKGVVDKGGKGKFYYKISFPATPVNAAAMKIEPVSHSGTPKTITLQTEDYSDYDIVEPDLDSGYYRVTITYSGSSDFDTSVITWILHIYPAMPTHYDFNLPALVRIGGLTVTFDANGGSFPGGGSTASVNNAVVASPIMTAPAVPTRLGHTFKGIWYKEAGQINVWDLVTERVWENVTLFAGWLAKEKFTVTFDKNTTGAVTNLPAPITDVYDGDTITEPAPPARTGNTFGGWYKEEGVTNPWNFATDTVTRNITLFAKWTADTCRVQFHRSLPTYTNPSYTVPLGDLSGMPSPLEYDALYGDTITEPADPSLAGYTFGGWYEDLACTTPWTFPITVTRATTHLYPKWIPKKYTVTFHANDTSISPITDWPPRILTDVEHNSKLQKPAIDNVEVPVRKDGAKPSSWRNGAADLWDFENDRVRGDLHLLAQWEKEITGDINVDADDDFVVVIGKDAWNHGFRISLNNSVNGAPNFIWKVTAKDNLGNIYEHTMDGTGDSGFRLPGVGDKTPYDPDKDLVYYVNPEGGGDSGYYAEGNMVWYVGKGFSPIIVTVEYTTRPITEPPNRKTLTFTIHFRDP
jgi:uncharacterized repeat protein (TIGR02543 family)